jgi:hypothetical protein
MLLSLRFFVVALKPSAGGLPAMFAYDFPLAGDQVLPY